MAPKHRSWHFYVMLITLTAVMGTYVLLKFTPLKNEVEAQIIRKLQPYLGEAFLIGDFRLGFNSIEFSQVRAADESQAFSIELDQIRVGYSPFRLLRYKFDPAKAVTSVEFKRPRLSLLYNDKLKVQSNRDFSLEKLMEQVLVGLQKSPQIDHISVTDAEWFLEMPGNTPLPILDKLNGRFDYRSGNKVVFVNLRGKFLGTEASSIDLVGNVDFSRKTMNADLVLEECLINSDWPFWKINFFRIDNARLQGKLQISSPALHQDSLVLGGRLRVDNFAASVFNQATSADSFYLQLINRKVKVEPFNCKVEEANANFYGIFTDILKPEVDWHLRFDNYNVKHLVQSHKVLEYAYEGRLQGSAHFTGPIKQIRIEASATTPDLLYGVVPFNNNRLDLKYDHATRLLEFPYLRANYYQWRTQGNGHIDFTDYTLQLNLDSDIAVPPGYFTLLTGLNEGAIRLRSDLRGDFVSRVFKGTGRYSVEGKDSVLATGHGPMFLDYDRFEFQLNPDDLADNFQFYGKINRLWSEPNIEIMEARNFPVANFTLNPLLAEVVHEKAVDFFFAGPYNRLTAKMKVMSHERTENFLVLNGNIRDMFYDNQMYEGRFTAFSAPKVLDGDFKIAFSAEGMDTRLQVADLFNCRIYNGFTAAAPLRGSLRLQQIDLAGYLANIPSMVNLVEKGLLQGELTLGGTVGQPELRFDLLADEFIVNDVGYYSTRFSGVMIDNVLRFDNSWVRLNGERVFNADIAYYAGSDSLDMRIRATDVESNFLAETLFRDRGFMKGKVSYSVIVQGRPAAPAVFGDVEVRDGKLKDISFDLITAAFEDSLLDADKYWDPESHILKVRRFLFSNGNDYALDGKGQLSLDAHGPVDVEINMRGNVLAELPRIEPYFMNPWSEGTLYAHIQGSRVNPIFKEVDLNILDGRLEFDGLLPPLTNLKVDIQLSDRDNVVDIRTIEGRLLGRHARIYNEPAVTMEDSLPLQPLYFEDMDLNFGVLVLETDELGIPMSIPGMMEEGDIGYFAAHGKTPSEKMYLSGPVNDFFLRGTTVMYDCRVTFPFIGMELDSNGEYTYAYPEDDRVIDFLINLRTDFSMLPGNNIRYFVNIPGYVGEVFMDLKIDNSSPGLTFKGRFVEESWRVLGGMESSRGRVEYLDVKFRVDRFGAAFSNYEILPEVYGRAYTTVRDTTDFPRDIYLQLYVIDPVTKNEVNRGRWEDFRFKLVSRERPSDPLIEETQEHLLSYLGYSFSNLQNKAGEVGLTMTENFLIRPLYRPLERQLERQFHLDYVRVRSSFTTNLFYLSFQEKAQFSTQPWFFTPNLNSNLNPALLLLQSSELTLGKYLLRDVYLTYSGQLVSGVDDSKLGVNHSFGVEYRLLRNLLLEVEYEQYRYNPFYENLPSDFLIRLRHSFNF